MSTVNSCFISSINTIKIVSAAIIHILYVKRQKVRQKAIRWPRGVCSKGVGSNSLQCTSCQKWVHKKCSGIKGSMSKVAKSFICRGCLNPVASAGRTSVNIAVQSWS